MTLNAIKSPKVLYFGSLLALSLLLLKWLEMKFIMISYDLELYTACISLLFMALGIWLTIRLIKPGSETKSLVLIQEDIISNPGQNHLSNREATVLQLMADGLSNQEIADRLFVSLNTIKTHSSKIFNKLEVKRRTQAIEKARKLKIIG